MGRNRTQEPIGKDYLEFGEKIKSLRQARKMTQEELSEALDISKTSVVNYETGTRKVPLSLIKKFARFFNRSVDELIGVNITSKGSEHSIYSSNPRVIKNTEQWYEEVGDVALSDDEMDELIRFTKYLIYKRGEK